MHSPGIDMFAKAFRAIRPRTPLPEFEVRFRPYADVNNVIRMRDNKVMVGLSDLLEGAPTAVLESIAFILVSKLYRKPIPERYQHRYRQFLNRRHVREQVHVIRRVRGRKWIAGAAGEHFHLEEVFERLNDQFFAGLMQRPNLTWSRSASRHSLGHFDAAHNTIVISKIFDRPDAPPFAVEYILYHEMLHLRHPVQHRRSRRCVHSAAFRAEERRFPQFEKAKQWIEQL
jgi:predicted metal-dependent hydrolase